MEWTCIDASPATLAAFRGGRRLGVPAAAQGRIVTPEVALTHEDRKVAMTLVRQFVNLEEAARLKAARNYPFFAYQSSPQALLEAFETRFV